MSQNLRMLLQSSCCCSFVILRGLYAAGFTASMLTSVTIDKPPHKSVADAVRVKILVELGANELILFIG